MSPNYFTINTCNISDDQVKWGKPKVRTVEADRKDIRQIILLEKRKHESLALKRSVKDNLDLILENNLLTDLDSC